MKNAWNLTASERREILKARGMDPDLPPRGVSYGNPPPGLRNWLCETDGHEDPDRSGLCIHCSADTC